MTLPPLSQHNLALSAYYTLYRGRKHWWPVYVMVEKASMKATAHIMHPPHAPATFVGNVGLPSHLRLRKPGKRQNLAMLLKSMHEKFDT